MASFGLGGFALLSHALLALQHGRQVNYPSNPYPLGPPYRFTLSIRL